MIKTVKSQKSQAETNGNLKLPTSKDFSTPSNFTERELKRIEASEKAVEAIAKFEKGEKK